ncbi:MAG: hypothetical protein OHK0011_02280 [Turneriella sp.]
MRYKWQNMKNPSWDYPEVYSTVTIHYDQIKVEANRALGQVRLEVKTLRGEHYESIIRHGTILREKDLRTGALTDLTDILSVYRKDFSSLPDTPILALIGGNYGIMTEFIGTAERIVVQDRHLLRRLMRLVKGIWPALKNWYASTRASFGYYWHQARKADLFDIALIGSSTYAAFTYNFDYLNAGFTLCIVAMLTGLVDWLIRKREPWLLKIYASIGLATVAVYRGYFFQ